MRTDKNVNVYGGGIGFIGACFILFVNFGNNNYDLYDAIVHYLMK